MSSQHSISRSDTATLQEVAEEADYSLLESLSADPQSTESGEDHDPRQVFSGHYVPVKPTPIGNPEYVAHSSTLFAELGFSDELAHEADFRSFFSGDLSVAHGALKEQGWATGYALSIYGREYYQQCPFQTGNGYGDGRAISVLEGCFNDRRWEMQLKGAGRTPYCRGGDGRAVLRSSVREFLAQEHMHALNVPTSRSLSLFVSRSEQVERPWYSENTFSVEPDRYVRDWAAISTRVAPSFLRVGQLELFARRARKNEHPEAMRELEQILLHTIDREYRQEIDSGLKLNEQFVQLARCFRERLTSLVANWIRVGFCQGNFNSDNCALGGFTLDYGPFGFMECFDTEYQPWTGGGKHFAFLNQPEAAARNYEMFWVSLLAWRGFEPAQLQELDAIRAGFADVMEHKLAQAWMAKLGLADQNAGLVRRLIALMQRTSVDYTCFFRELSNLPETLEPLRASFYSDPSARSPTDEAAWSAWLYDWRAAMRLDGESRTAQEVITQMKAVNPKYVLREWHLVPAYRQAAQGDYALIRELQAVMADPYAEQGEDTQERYCALKPAAYFGVGGVSHMSCSS
ncbi:MAG: protein adenylyltransferase SelO family protein [Myxococcota bacterium]